MIDEKVKCPFCGQNGFGFRVPYDFSTIKSIFEDSHESQLKFILKQRMGAFLFCNNCGNDMTIGVTGIQNIANFLLSMGFKNTFKQLEASGLLKKQAEEEKPVPCYSWGCKSPTLEAMKNRDSTG